MILLNSHAASITSLQFYSPSHNHYDIMKEKKWKDEYEKLKENNNFNKNKQTHLLSSSFDTRIIEWKIDF